MVYSLVCLAVKRNLVCTSKSILHSDFLLLKRTPSHVLPLCPYSDHCESDQDKRDKQDKYQHDEEKNKSSALRNSSLNFPDGKSHINYIISQLKMGKLPGNEITALAQRVISEGKYKAYSEAPQTVQIIGFAGLLPMLGIPILTLLNGHALPGLVFTHLSCGATILSFIGGSSWHEAITKKEISYDKLVWCIAPQLIGWIALLLPLPLGIIAASAGFCLSLTHDVLLTNYPQWMKSLRLILTAGVVASFGLMSRRRSWSSTSRSGSSKSGRERSKSSRSTSLCKKRTSSKSNSSKSHSRSRSNSREKPSKIHKRSRSRSSLSSTQSSKKEESPPKTVIPRYYGRNRKDSSSSLSLDSSDSESKTNTGQPSSTPILNNNKKSGLDEYISSSRSAGNARSTSKPSTKEKPQEKLKKKMQALLNKQFKADKKAEKERLEKAEQERQDREAELRDIAIKIRRRERYLRHRGEDEENDGERESMRRRERHLRRLGEDDGKREKKSGDGRTESSGSGRSHSRSPESKRRRSRSPRRNSRRSRSSSPRPSRSGKRTLVDY